jgi:hypothetical protein
MIVIKKDNVENTLPWFIPTNLLWTYSKEEGDIPAVGDVVFDDRYHGTERLFGHMAGSSPKWSKPHRGRQWNLWSFDAMHAHMYCLGESPTIAPRAKKLLAQGGSWAEMEYAMYRSRLENGQAIRHGESAWDFFRNPRFLIVPDSEHIPERGYVQEDEQILLRGLVITNSGCLHGRLEDLMDRKGDYALLQVPVYHVLDTGFARAGGGAVLKKGWLHELVVAAQWAVAENKRRKDWLAPFIPRGVMFDRFSTDALTAKGE